MCRWVAYAGPEIYLEDLIFHQTAFHSEPELGCDSILPGSPMAMDLA